LIRAVKDIPHLSTLVVVIPNCAASDHGDSDDSYTAPDDNADGPEPSFTDCGDTFKACSNLENLVFLQIKGRPKRGYAAFSYCRDAEGKITSCRGGALLAAASAPYFIQGWVSFNGKGSILRKL